MTALDKSFTLTVSLPIIFCSTSTSLPFSQVRNPFLTVSNNKQQLDVTKIPNAILQMAYLKLFIPLSMLTTSALTRIHANDGLKYHKIPFGNGTGKQSLDELIFPPEESLSESL